MSNKFQGFTIELTPLQSITTWDEIDDIERAYGEVRVKTWDLFKKNDPVLAQQLAETLPCRAGLDPSVALAIAQTTARTLVARGELVAVAQHDARAVARIAIEMDRTARMRADKPLSWQARARIAGKRARVASKRALRRVLYALT